MLLFTIFRLLFWEATDLKRENNVNKNADVDKVERKAETWHEVEAFLVQMLWCMKQSFGMSQFHMWITVKRNPRPRSLDFLDPE